MVMGSRLRKIALTAHVASSVGWLGAVAAFLLLAVQGLVGADPQTVKAAYLSMAVIGWRLIVPIALISLATGLIQSLGTEWGLFRYYWVLLKFVLTIGATFLLLLHMQPTDQIAQIAATTAIASADLHGARVQLVVDAAGATGVLLLLTMLSMYKPWGLTRYRWRQQRIATREAAVRTRRDRGAWGRRILIGLGVLVLLVIVIHLMGGGLGHHLK